MILVLMGVTGAGKTTIGECMAVATGWQFADADDFHSEANRSKMHAGIPLTDEDRAPWLRSLHELLLRWNRSGTGGILACSALKQSYRDSLAGQIPSGCLRFVLLEVSRQTLMERLAARKGHYMNPALLGSQIDTLEAPANAIRVSGEGPPEEIVRAILGKLDG